MARIAGVNIPTNKRVIIALTYITGIGRTKAVEIADKLGIDHSRRVQDLTDAEVLQIRETIDAEHTVEGDLRRETAMNIKRLMDLASYRGFAGVSPSVASARTPMRAPARVKPSRSPARRNRTRKQSGGLFSLFLRARLRPPQSDGNGNIPLQFLKEYPNGT